MLAEITDAADIAIRCFAATLPAFAAPLPMFDVTIAAAATPSHIDATTPFSFAAFRFMR